MHNRSHIQEAEFFIQTNRWKDARKAIKAHLESDFEDDYAFALLGLCEMELHNPKAAQRALQKSLSLYPENDYTHFLIAHLEFDREKWEKAEASVLTALEINPNNPMYFSLLARIQYNSGKHHSGQKAIEDGLKIDPNHPDLLEIKALYHLRYSESPEAVESLRHGLQEDPENPQLLYLMGTHHLDKGNPKKAKALFESALSKDPSLENARMGLVEAQKSSSWLFRLFFNYGFSRWHLKFGWWMILWIIVGIKTVAFWGAFFVLFLLFTWYGDVLYNTVLRIGKHSRFLLSDSKIIQSNFFLAVNGLILLIILMVNLTGDEYLWKVMIITWMVLFMGLAWFHVSLKRQKNSILFTSIFLLVLSFLAFATCDLPGFIVTCLGLLVLFGLLFSFRVIGW